MSTALKGAERIEDLVAGATAAFLGRLAALARYLVFQGLGEGMGPVVRTAPV